MYLLTYLPTYLFGAGLLMRILTWYSQDFCCKGVGVGVGWGVEVHSIVTSIILIIVMINHPTFSSAQ